MASRSRSRSPLKQDNESPPASDRASPALSNISVTTPTSNISDKNKGKLSNFSRIKESKYHLKLSYVPLSWHWKQVSAYIKKNTYRVDKAIIADVTFISLKIDPVLENFQESVIMFKTEHYWNQAFQALKQTWDIVEGKKLFVQKAGGTKSTKSNERIVRYQQLRSLNIGSKPTYNTFSRDGGDENETYGLSAKYLNDLGITVKPLTRKVFVRNLPEQCNDEDKVRSIFSMAGTLVAVQLLHQKHDCVNARLEYDHPVEAVQAVSMFNHRELYGTLIRCEMDTLAKKIWIDGMPMRGPGLGPDGLPMRGVRVAVEIKKLKSEVMSEVRKLNDTLDELKAQVTNLMMQVESNKGQPNSAFIQNVANPLQNVANPLQNVANPLQNVANPLQNVVNPLAALGSLLTNQFQPMQLLQGLLQQNTGNDMGVLGNALKNFTGSNMDLSGLIQGLSNNQSGPVQSGSSMEEDPNMQGASNMQGGHNMQSGHNMQNRPDNMLGGPSNNMPHGSFNIQNGPASMQSGHATSNMQRVPNNMQSGHNNLQIEPNNMQSRPNNMQSGPNNMQSGPHHMPSGSNNMLSGSYGSSNIQSGPNVQPLHQNMQHSRPFIQGQNNNPGFNGQPNQPSGFANMQSGFPNMQPQQNQQNNTGYGAPHFNNNMDRQETAGSSSNMLLFRNLPSTVTLPALQGKMREVGEVKLVEMTGPGRALVSFYSDYDADKCIRLFNQSKVDGQTIEVKKV